MAMRILLLFLLFSSTSTAIASPNRAMQQAYQGIIYSLRAGKMQFDCDNGLTRYRIQSDFGSRPRLYWHTPETNSWVEVQDVVFNDTNISFEGSSMRDIELSNLTSQIHLPIFNRSYKDVPNRYFYKANREQHAPYLFIIDTAEQTSSASNIEPQTEKIALDKQRYLTEQAYISPIRTTNQHRLEMASRLAQERTQLLEAISLQYKQGVSIHIPPYTHKKVSRCYYKR